MMQQWREEEGRRGGGVGKWNGEEPENPTEVGEIIYLSHLSQCTLGTSWIVTGSNVCRTVGICSCAAQLVLATDDCTSTQIHDFSGA